MRPILQISIFVLVFMIICNGCSQSATVESERAKLQGIWEVVQDERHGEDVPAIGQKYEFEDSRFRIVSGPTHINPWNEYELNVDTNPSQMDWPATITNIDGTVEKGALLVIYKIESDKLLICSPMIPARPRPTAFSSRPDNDLLTLKRIPFADAKEELTRNEAARTRGQEGAFYRLSTADIRKDNGKYYIDFRGASFIGTIARRHWQDLLDLRDVRELRFRACAGVGNEEMDYLGKLVSLESLDLHSTNVSDMGIVKLSGMVNLEQLDLSFTAVTDAALVAISKLAKLKKLTLNGSLVTEKGIGELRTKRSDLDVVWRRPYTESQQKAALAISQLGFRVNDDFDPYLKPKTVTCQIVFPNRKIVATSVVAEEAKKRPPPYGGAKSIDQSEVTDLLEKLPAPTSVSAVGSIDDTIFICLRNIQGLVWLDVAGTKITDAGLAELKNHQTLKVLNLKYAKNISNTGVASLASLVNLEVLNVAGIKSTSDSFSKLLHLDNLRELHITYKQINKTLSSQFQQKGVELIDIN